MSCIRLLVALYCNGMWYKTFQLYEICMKYLVLFTKGLQIQLTQGLDHT